MSLETPQQNQEDEVVAKIELPVSTGNEQGVLSRLNRRMGKSGRALAAGISLMGMASSAAIAPESAEANSKQEQMDPAKQYETTTVQETWSRLLQIPDQPTALNQAHNEVMKGKVAKSLIYQLAARLKVGPNFQAKPGESVLVTNQDVRRAMEILNGSVESACASLKGGDCSLEELNQFNQRFSQSAAGKIFLEMMQR